jgi:hypothetical protein
MPPLPCILSLTDLVDFMFGTGGFPFDEPPGGPHPGAMPHVETAAAGEMCSAFNVLCPIACSLPMFCMTYVVCA